MKNLELLPLDSEKAKRLKKFGMMYKRNARIEISVVSFDGKRLIVRTEQKESVGGRLLRKEELTERVREMFAGEIPEDWTLTVSAVDYDRQDIECIDVEWIKERMQKYSLKNKHLSNYTGIDRFTISSILSGEKELTKWHKVAFYYFFKFLDCSHFC